LKKRAKYILIAGSLAILFFGAMISLVLWAWNSAEGTRLLLKTVSLLSPVKIDAEKVDGRLRDELKLRGLSVRWAQGEVRVDLLHLNWQPAELWNRRVIVNDLFLGGVVFQDRGSEVKKPFFPAWPLAPFWLTRIQARIESFRLRGLVYRRPDREPLRLDQMLARGEWDGRSLAVQDLVLSGPWGNAEGAGKMGFGNPSLHLDLKGSFAHEYAVIERVAVKIFLEPGSKPDQAEGAIWISGQKKNIENLFLESELALAPEALTWRNLRFRRPDRKGTLQSEGSWNFAARPSLQGRLGFSELDLTPESGIPTNLFGELEIKGPLDDYRGRILLINKVKGWANTDLSGEIRGNLRGIIMPNLNASWLDGKVGGGLGFSWADAMVLEGKLQGKNLNPGGFDPEWPGELNLKLEGKIFLRDKGLSETTVTANFSESRVRDWRFTGETDAALKNDLWKISRLYLKGQGFVLQAEGVLQERVNLNARLTDLSRFIPGARGEISTAGWARYRNNRFSGVLQGQGKDLVRNDIRAEVFTAEFKLSESSQNVQPSFFLQGRLQNITAGNFRCRSLDLETKGSLKRHEAKITLHAEGGEIQSELSGGYEEGVWEGTLTGLTAKEAKGFWDLRGPAKIQWSPRKILLTPVILKGGQGEAVQIEGNLEPEPLTGDARVEWKRLDLARVNPWLGIGKLSGQSTGAIRAKAGKGGMQVSGTSTLNGTFAYEQVKAEGFSGRARCDWNEKGLSASVTLNLKEGGSWEARVSSEEGIKAKFPESGRIETNWEGIDHALLSPVFPSRLSLKGRSSGRAAGQWFPGFEFEAAGDVSVSRSEVKWQTAKNPISLALQKGGLKFSWREDRLQGDVALTLEDHGALRGTFELPLAAKIRPSFHSEEKLKIVLNGQLQEKGFLAALFPEKIIQSDGNLDLNFLAEGSWDHPRFRGTVRLADTTIRLTPGKEVGKGEPPPELFNLQVTTGSAVMKWGDGGLDSSFNLEFRNHGSLEGKLASSQAAQFSFPGNGQMEIIWGGVDLALLRPLGPKQLSLEGQAAGQIKGSWQSDFRLETAGDIKLAKGKLGWRMENGLISAGIDQGSVSFSWKGESLRGDLSLALEGYGSLQGNFHLAIPARVPFAIEPGGNVRAAFRGQVLENGLLTAFFPGTVQESSGKMHLDFQIDGTWEKPGMKGTAQLAEAGAFLPGLGIRVEGVSLRSQFLEDRIRIESFQARSGPGRIEGNGVVWLKNWEVQRYEGKIWGDRFLTLYLPDLRIQSSPKLEFQGGRKRLSVRGDVLLPEVLAQASSSPGMVHSSSDVVILDQPPAGPASYSLDMQVRIALGDRVTVKAGGLESRLTGNLDLKAKGIQTDQMTARGEIRVKEGTYTGYGLSLRIERGRLLFGEGPIDNPALDILALRREDILEGPSEIQVGIVILGNLQRPTVKLYSRPPMKDEDILSYLLEGRPYDRQRANLSLLMAGAQALLGGDSPGPVDKLKTLAGIDKVDIESQGGDLSRSMVTVGKYLTPKLYISYGYSLFNNEQVLRVRYKISKSWEVEAHRGIAAGADLYYRIDFF